MGNQGYKNAKVTIVKMTWGKGNTYYDAPTPIVVVDFLNDFNAEMDVQPFQFIITSVAKINHLVKSPDWKYLYE